MQYFNLRFKNRNEYKIRGSVIDVLRPTSDCRTEWIESRAKKLQNGHAPTVPRGEGRVPYLRYVSEPDL
jgi:hypothetical protein